VQKYDLFQNGQLCFQKRKNIQNPTPYRTLLQLVPESGSIKKKESGYNNTLAIHF